MNTNIDLPKEFIQQIVEAVSAGVGDNVKKVLRQENIDPKHSNSKGHSVYDYINRNIRELNNRRFITEYAKACSWNYVPIYDTVTGYIYVLLKKDRYEELIREKNNKKKGTKFSHYIYADTNIINADIEPEYVQLSFLEPEEDEKLLYKVENMLRDIHVPFDMVNRFALLLFEVANYELTSISCCIPDRDFNIRYQYSWNEYINYENSIITDIIDETDIVEEDNRVRTPSLVSLSDKARGKVGQGRMTKTKHKKDKSSEGK